MVDIAVVAPSAHLTVTIERSTTGEGDEIHLHPGGQGFWVARVLHELGADAALCCPVGGEAGAVFRALLASWGVVDRTVTSGTDTASYVHDRRDGERRVVAEAAVPVLDRHGLDDLYSEGLALAVEAGCCVVAGRPHGAVVPDDFYRRLGADLAGMRVPVVGDLHGDELLSFLEGGPLDVLKVSEDDLRQDGATPDPTDDDALWSAIVRLHHAGAHTVVVSRADRSTFALVRGRRFEVSGPALDVVEHRGAGDSMTAGLAAGLAMKAAPADMLRLATAAAGANVVRHGLGTASVALIDSLTERVQVTELT